MATPMIEKIVQTAKQAVKAIVLRARARFWSGLEMLASVSKPKLLRLSTC